MLKMIESLSYVYVTTFAVRHLYVIKVRMENRFPRFICNTNLNECDKVLDLQLDRLKRVLCLSTEPFVFFPLIIMVFTAAQTTAFFENADQMDPCFDTGPIGRGRNRHCGRFIGVR